MISRLVPRRSGFLALGALLLTLSAVSGCAPKITPVPVPVPTADLESALLRRLDENADAFRSVAGLAKVRGKNGDETFSGTQVLMAEKPGRLRAEVLNPFGQPVLVLASNGAELEVLVPGKREFFSGPASPAMVRKFLRLPLGLEDLVRILLYQVPRLEYRQRHLEPEEGGGWRLVLKGADESRQEFAFDSRLRLVRAEYFLAGELQLAIRYDKFLDQVPAFPGTVDLAMPEQQGEMTLSFSEVRVNPEIPPERFSLEAPPGFTAKPLP